jgi:hypothetical protein
VEIRGSEAEGSGGKRREAEGRERKWRGREKEAENGRERRT